MPVNRAAWKRWVGQLHGALPRLSAMLLAAVLTSQGAQSAAAADIDPLPGWQPVLSDLLDSAACVLPPALAGMRSTAVRSEGRRLARAGRQWTRGTDQAEGRRDI